MKWVFLFASAAQAAVLRPAEVGAMITRMEESWTQEAVSALQDVTKAKAAKSNVVQSCSSFVNTLISASSGDKDKVEQYLSDVCSASQSAGCVELKHGVLQFLTFDPERNRDAVKSAKFCADFYASYVEHTAQSEERTISAEKLKSELEAKQKAQLKLQEESELKKAKQMKEKEEANKLKKLLSEKNAREAEKKKAGVSDRFKKLKQLVKKEQDVKEEKAGEKKKHEEKKKAVSTLHHAKVKTWDSVAQKSGARSDGVARATKALAKAVKKSQTKTKSESVKKSKKSWGDVVKH